MPIGNKASYQGKAVKAASYVRDVKHGPNPAALGLNLGFGSLDMIRWVWVPEPMTFSEYRRNGYHRSIWPPEPRFSRQAPLSMERGGCRRGWRHGCWFPLHPDNGSTDTPPRLPAQPRYCPQTRPMTTPPWIMHLDMDAFFAAIEQRDDPSLRGMPVVVGAQPGGRGVVATCSYEAREFGIHSAMPMNEAHRRCPGAEYLRPDMGRYVEASRSVMQVLETISPMVEPVSIDEACVDVTAQEQLLGTPEQIDSILAGYASAFHFRGNRSGSRMVSIPTSTSRSGQ